MGWLGFGRKRAADSEQAPNPFREVEGSDDFLSELGDGLAVIYKHSNRCSLCSRAIQEVRQFADRHPSVPVFMIDVVNNRPASSLVAERFDVIHQSPQALVIRDGEAVWDASHLSVTAGELEGAIA